ncbi:MAG: LEA type 2 family protein [Pseudomonadota bacterium]
MPLMRKYGLSRTLLIVLSAWLLAACAGLPLADFDEPEVELLGLTPVVSDGIEARFKVKLRVVNPNDVDLSVRGLAYDLVIRERKLFTGVSNDPIDIDAFGETIVDLEVAAGVLNSLALIRDLMSSPPDDGLPYRLDVKLSLAGVGPALRVSREGVIDLTPSRL